HARALADIHARPPTPKTISRVRSGRSRRTYRTVLEVIDLYRRYLARLDRAAIRDAVENHALVTSRDPVLLELLCVFTTVATLRDSGWITSEPGLLRPPRILHAQKGRRILDLYYQHAPRELTRGSVYRELQQSHGFVAVGGLIPDLVIRTETPSSLRWLM